MPIARASGRQFLTKTLEESYHMYQEDCKKSDKKGVSFSTFCHLHPKNIYKINQTPNRQCICDQCENFQLMRQVFQYNQIKRIPLHTDLCIKQGMCDVINDENNADGLHQVDPAYGNFKCITHNCKKCGPDNVLLEILKQNPGIEDSKELIEFNGWDWVPKPGSKYKRLDLVTDTKRKIDVVNLYLQDLHSMSFHLFTCNWNYLQFLHVKENIWSGELIQVLNFRQNYMNTYQDEPQPVHWDHRQTIIHPIINYYLNSEGKLTTEDKKNMINLLCEHLKRLL